MSKKVSNPPPPWIPNPDAGVNIEKGVNPTPNTNIVRPPPPPAPPKPYLCPNCRKGRMK